MSQRTHTVCPFCAEEIRAQAVKCKHCHEVIKPKEKDSPGTPDKQGESVVAVIYPVWQEYGWQFFWGLLLLPLFGAGLIILLLAFARQYSQKYVLTTKKFIVHEGLFSHHKQVYNLGSVSRLSVKQTPLQRILNCGKVVLTFPGIQVETKKISNPDKFAATINKYKP
jgi:membrane protein YdbS with pleckstrin-like domain